MRFFLKLLSVTAFVTSGLVIALGSPASAVGTASAEEETSYPDEFTVTLADCQVTVQANSIPYHVSSGERTAGLAIRVNGETVAYTAPEKMENRTGSEFYEFNESLSSGPVVDGDVVEFRWFAGPVRNDLPLWDLDHPELNEIIDQVERPDGEFVRHWNAGDDAEFVNWYTFGKITGCPPATETETETPSSPPSNTTEKGTTTEKGLPPTGEGGDENNAAAIVAAGAGTLLGGLLLYWLIKARRERLTETED